MLFVKAILFAALFTNCYCAEDNDQKVVEVEKLLRYINSNAATARQKAKSGSSYPSGQSISLSASSYGGGSNSVKSYGSAPSAPSVYSYGSGSSDSSLSGSGSISSYQQQKPVAPAPSNYGSSSGSSSYSSSGSNAKPASKPKVEYDDPYGYNYYGVSMGQDDGSSNNFFGDSSSFGNQLGNVGTQFGGQVFCQDMQPIFEGDRVTEQYCRCSDGSYGFTCTEGYGNPCLFGNSQFFPADPRLPRYYFIHCSWNIPYLKKCAARLFWNQDLLTCAWA